VLLEKSRQESEMNVSQLQQQLSTVTQRCRQADDELKLTVQKQKQAYDSDVDRLMADKVCRCPTQLTDTFHARCSVSFCSMCSYCNIVCTGILVFISLIFIDNTDNCGCLVMWYISPGVTKLQSM